MSMFHFVHITFATYNSGIIRKILVPYFEEAFEEQFIVVNNEFKEVGIDRVD